MKNLILIFSMLFSYGLMFFVVAKLNPSISNYETRGLMKKNIKKIHEDVSDLEHFDENFDDYEENYEEEFENFARQYKRNGMSDAKARQASYNKMSAKHGTRFERSVVKAGNASHNIKGSPVGGGVALFDLILKRDSVNIGYALPVPLFGALHKDSLYNGIIQQYMPNGVTLTGITYNANGDLVFKYTEGSSNDTITVSCVQTPYVTFLNASQFNPMSIERFRYQISDVAQLAQFSQRFEVATKSLFGKAGQNQVSVGAQKRPDQFQAGIIDVDYVIHLNGESAIVVGLVNVAGFSVTLSCTVSKYKRSNINA